MRILITRSAFLHFSSPPRPLQSPLRLFHSGGGGDDQHRRRSDTSSSPSRRHHDEESRNVRVSVWWDFENCSVPVDVNVFRVAQRITDSLRSSGIRGPVTINAFGDVAQMSRATQEALTSTGVSLTHVPQSGKNSSDLFFMSDLIYWISQNPPPVHFFLISSDKDFSNILHRLRMSNYNVLLSSTERASSVLCSAATIMWPWNGLVRGEDVNVKHFNHPPDGPYGSWYGYYKGNLADPFMNMEQTASQHLEAPVEQTPDAKPRPVPKAVINGIRHVLRSYPEGIYMSELRSELKMNNIVLDKDFFGHKKFSLLLSSIPTIVKFIPCSSVDSQPLVAGIHRKVAEPFDLNSKATKEGEIPDGEKGEDLAQNKKSQPLTPATTLVKPSTCKMTYVDTGATIFNATNSNDPIPEVGLVERINRAFSEPKLTAEEPSLPVSETHITPLECSLPDKKTTSQIYDGVSAPKKEHHVEVEEGIFKRIWNKLVGYRGVHSINRNDKNSIAEPIAKDYSKDVPNVHNTDHSGKVKSEEKDARSTSSTGSPNSVSVSVYVNKLLTTDSTDGQPELVDGHGRREGLFSHLTRWLKFKKSSEETQDDSSAAVKDVINSQGTDAAGERVEALTSMSFQPEEHDLFSKPYFWRSLEFFFQTQKGSDLILQSRTRKQLVNELLMKSALLKNLKKSHVDHLVELLISEKKWVEESTSSKFPFKLALPAPPRSGPSQTNGLNNLSTIFTGKTSNSSGPLSSVTAPPQNLTELNDWLQTMSNSRGNIEPDDFQRLFESKFNRKLVSSFYGYPTVRSLITACLSHTANYQEKKRRSASREEMLSDCRRLLMELLDEFPTGYNISIFKPRFVLRYGYALDFETLGYHKLASLLQIMPGVKIESSFVLPSEMIPNAENKRNDGEESVWEELGPLSKLDDQEAVAKEAVSLPKLDDQEAAAKEAVSLPKLDDQEAAAKEAVSFEETLLPVSDEEISDSDNESNGKQRRRDDNSFFLQLLDSCKKDKEGCENDPQAVEGLVDCSRSNHQNRSSQRNMESLKLKIRPLGRYRFVSDAGGDDDKQKKVESILGSLTREARIKS